MNNMVRYEIKKVFSKKGGKTAILALLLLLAVTCFFATDVVYVNEKGIEETGYAAVSKLRHEINEWEGYLDEDKLRQAIEENIRIEQTPEAQSKDWHMNNIAYSWKQGFSRIRDLLNYSFASGFREYDYYRADSLKPEDAPRFYENRIRLLKEWLEKDETKYMFSEAEKAYLIKQYEELETPFYYDYMEGFVNLLEYSPTIIMITVLIIGYVVAGIFANEFIYKADPVFFSSYYGRNKAVAAKIKAGFNIYTIIYWIILLLYSTIVLMYLGTDGWNSPIQADMSGWKCFYNIKMWQAYLLTVSGGYVGGLFMCFLAMYVSARTRSSVLAVMAPFVLIFIPSFISNIDSPVINKILGLLPDRLLQVNEQLKYFDLYQLGGHVTGAVPILFIVYGTAALLLVPAMYIAYRKKQ